MFRQHPILTDEINSLRQKANDLEIIGNFCKIVIDYLMSIDILDHYVIHTSGSAMIVLNKHDINEDILKYTLKDILKDQEQKNKFFIDWVCFKHSTISHIYCDWYREDIVHNNGWNGKDLNNG